MPQLNNRNVSSATLQAVVHFANIGQFGPKIVVNETNQGTKAISKMTIIDGNLVLEVGKSEIAIPLANVAGMMLVPENKK